MCITECARKAEEQQIDLDREEWVMLLERIGRSKWTTNDITFPVAFTVCTLIPWFAIASTGPGSNKPSHLFTQARGRRLGIHLQARREV